MSAYLSLSFTHGLIPLAWRLHREGHESAFAPWQHRGAKCWGARSLQNPFPQDETSKDTRKLATRAHEALAPWLDRARAGELAILSDCPKWTPILEGIPGVWGTHPVEGTLGPIRLGGWVDAEGVLQAPHLLWVAMGAWPGGMGAHVEAGATLVPLRGSTGPFQELLEAATSAAETLEHRGLVQVGLVYRDGGWAASGIALGWHGLHLHAWLAALGEGGLVGKVLAGEAPTFPHRYTVVVPVSVPPWPTMGSVLPAEQQVQIGDEAAGRVFWHDVAIDEGARVMKVAGVDGLIGVARGSADSMTLARIRAYSTVGAMQVWEKQARLDVGQGVEDDLAKLEAAGFTV